ncbi:MAG TPA: electron transfer flavoprotein subunit beta/FixA family protein [Candidatus Tectomicrobia bacterium]|nr:electron transfer flavoprotein subunit beta/FixA family protein [Candidatus Tectomicrobia bacterium]
MPLQIIVTAKQVIDPEIPKSAFKIEATTKRVVIPASFPPVVNGFDEHAVEAALRLKDTQEAKVTVLAVGKTFSIDIMRKLLAMGADELVLVQDPAIDDTVDSRVTVQLLSAAIRKLGEFDLILCGRQASDWDNAQVPLMLTEELGVPCITIAKRIEVSAGTVRVERVIPDGYEVVEAPLPALITVSNELGLPRYPTMRAIMAANRKRPTLWKLSDVGLDPASLQPRLQLVDLFVPVQDQACEFIDGSDEREMAHKLFQKLREGRLI